MIQDANLTILQHIYNTPSSSLLLPTPDTQEGAHTSTNCTPAGTLIT